MTDFPSSPEIERENFIKEMKHLDCVEMPDAWGRPMFQHSHVQALWDGWKARAAFDLAPCPDLPGMQGAVQYRRKDGGYGDRWITMAMFDGTLAAESYCSQQRKDDAWPFEYRAIELPASPDTSTDREGK
jgi:hypothetical protein